MAAGGLPVRRIDQRLAATSHAGVGPAPSNVFVGTRVIVFGTGPGRGIFVYSPTPGADNLVASIAAANGTDPFGNRYLAGFTTYGLVSGAFLAVQMVGGPGNANINWYSNGSAHQNVAYTTYIGVGSTGSANGLSVNIPAGIFSVLANPVQFHAAQTLLTPTGGAAVTSATLEVQGSLGLANGSAPGASIFAAESYATAGVEHGLTGAGFDGGKSLAPPADVTTRTVTAITATQLTGSLTLPANDVSVGTTYRLRAMGIGTQGSTAQNLTLNLNALGSGTLATQTIGAGFAGISTGFRWVLDAEVTCLTTGAGGTGLAVLSAWFDSGATSLPATSTNAIRLAAGAIAWNTTAAQTMRIDALWASATGAPTISCTRTTFERIGP